MLGQLVAAQFDLESVIADLMRSGSSAGPAQSQLLALTRLQREIGTADAITLATLQGSVASVIAQSQTIAQQGRSAAAETGAGDSADLTRLAAANRAQVDAVMRGMKDFDPDLTFASPEEEAEYRRRAAERRACNEAEQSKGTPQGNLNASAGALGQMADAKAHGADDNPDFQKRWDALVDSTEKLRAQLIRDGKDVSEFDNRLREDLRRILKSKGVSDAEIEARLAAHPDNPLEAVKDYVSERDVREIEVRQNRVKDTATVSVAPEAFASPLSRNIANSFDAAMADLAPTKFAVASHDPGADPAHGVTAHVIAPDGRGTALS